MAKPLTDDERARIVDLLNEGHSAAEVAKQAGRSKGTVANIAKSIGHRFGQSNLASARAARSAYTAERRAISASKAQEVLDALLGAVPTEIEFEVTDARGARDLAVAVETLQRMVLNIDKHDNRDSENLSGFDAWWADRMGGGA